MGNPHQLKNFVIILKIDGEYKIRKKEFFSLIFREQRNYLMVGKIRNLVSLKVLML